MSWPLGLSLPTRVGILIGMCSTLVLKEAQPIFFGHAIAAMTAELSGRPLVHIQLFHTHHDVDPNFFPTKENWSFHFAFSKSMNIAFSKRVDC